MFKTACFKLRGLEMNSKFNCKDCNLSFINNTNLNTHLEICKKYVKEQPRVIYVLTTPSHKKESK